MEKVKNLVLRHVIQIVVLLFLYFICRALFIATYYNELNFSESFSMIKVFFGGIRFDLSSIIVANSIYFILAFFPAPRINHQVYQQGLKGLFILTNSFFLLLNLVDIAYFPFVSKRMQADTFLFVTGEKGEEFFQLLPGFLLQYWHLLILYIVIVFGVIKLYVFTHRLTRQTSFTFINFGVSLLTFLLFIGLSVLGIRGGLQLKPLQLIHASEMTVAQNIPAIINSPFSVYTTWDKKGLQEKNYFSKEEMKSLPDGIHRPAKSGAFSSMNVVIIMVESLSKKHLGYFNSEMKTPFLDSLVNQSILFTNAFANARESIQGIPAVLASIPAWMDDSFIFSPYAANKITSFPNLLKEKGYHTSFFHGGNNGTMGFDLFSKLAGFDAYYGRNEYNNEKDYDGGWGIWDEHFLQFMSVKLSEMPQPFFSTVLTLNTHHPFSIPEEYRDRFTQEGHPLLACFQYLDYSLEKFFQSASKQEWFHNTLFIITADHAAPAIGDEHKSALENYQIPILFYMPDSLLKGNNEKIANQIDILPSVMALLNYDKPYFSLGQNLFDPNNETISINYRAGVYQYIDSTYCYQFNGQQGLGLYNWKKNPLFTENQMDKSDLVFSREQRLKQSIQLFNEVMINNRMEVLRD